MVNRWAVRDLSGMGSNEDGRFGRPAAGSAGAAAVVGTNPVGRSGAASFSYG